MAQGEGASLLVRIYHETSEERFAEAALKAIGPLSRTPRAGGAMAQLEHGIFLEEYPTDPPSCVLNGGMFAIWGASTWPAPSATRTPSGSIDESVETLAGMLDRYDTGYWSRYDLFPHAVTNVASPAYHRLHIEQLKAMALLPTAPSSRAPVRCSRPTRSDAWPGRAPLPTRRHSESWFLATGSSRVACPGTGPPASPGTIQRPKQALVAIPSFDGRRLQGIREQHPDPDAAA